MSRRVYDLSMATSLAMCTAGAWVQWGVGLALLIGGGLLGVYTLAAVVLVRR